LDFRFQVYDLDCGVQSSIQNRQIVNLWT
jgi:hypothetical protein